MLAIYVRGTTWLAAQRDKARLDDRGAVSVESAILIGILGAAAIAVGSALTLWVSNRMGTWQD